MKQRCAPCILLKAHCRRKLANRSKRFPIGGHSTKSLPPKENPSQRNSSVEISPRALHFLQRHWPGQHSRRFFDIFRMRVSTLLPCCCRELPGFPGCGSGQLLSQFSLHFSRAGQRRRARREASEIYRNQWGWISCLDGSGCVPRATHRANPGKGTGDRCCRCPELYG